MLAWSDLRDQVATLNPRFAEIVDKISPDKKHSIIKASYPYGSLMLKQAKLQIPNSAGNIVPLTDDSVDSEIYEALAYNLHSNPVSMVLSKGFEVYYPLSDRTIPLQGVIKPGSVFGTWRILNPEQSHQPAFLWDMSAGARSMFLLPKVSEEKRHFKLKRAYDLTVDKPNTLLDHWEIFREIANHDDFQQPWQAEILFFSKEWFEHVGDPAWMDFYYYLYETGWKGTEFWRNQPVWNLILSVILKDYQAKPSAYITDTAKYLIHMGIGALPGFAPAVDDWAGPISGLQSVYEEVYGLTQYPPVIMQPAKFDLYDQQKQPVYYSLHFPTALELGPSSRTRKNLLTDLHELRSLLIRYEQELLSGKFNIENTPVSDLFEKAIFDYFHANVELHAGMLDSADLIKQDARFLKTVNGSVSDNFPHMAAFLKGCIRVSHKD